MGESTEKKGGLLVFDEWKVEKSTFSDGLEGALREFLAMVREESKGFTRYLFRGVRLWRIIGSYDFGRNVILKNKKSVEGYLPSTFCFRCLCVYR